MFNPYELILKARHYLIWRKYRMSRRELPVLEGGYGACGQDILVAELLNNKRNGVFVDIGANDGITISNTYYFEKTLGWSGIAVEPIPGIYSKLKSNRSCITINSCITTTPGKAKFLELDGNTNMLSTLAVNNNGLVARRLRKNASRHNTEIREIEVECLTFPMMIEKFGIDNIDFLSLDIEGGELDILKSIDFETTPVKIISVENNYFRDDIRDYLEGKGFIYVGTFKVDEIYLYCGDNLRKAATKMR